MTDNPLVEAVAKAVRFTQNPLDGDPIGVMIHNYDFLEADTLDGQIALVDQVCAVIATAALRAIEDAGYRIEKVGNPNLKG